MKNVLFVLIDDLEKSFFLRYQEKLKTIHQNLLDKLSMYDVLVVGNENSTISSYQTDNLKSLYTHISNMSKDRDIVICHAYAGMLSLKDTEFVIEYMRNKIYDVCLTENLPEGLVPMAISHNFIQELVSYIEENQEITASFKNIINWEYKGIDVGVYISPSLLIMERIDFIPKNKGSVEYIHDLSTYNDISLENMSHIIKEYPQLLRHYPQYIAIEIAPQTDGFYTKTYSDQLMSLEIFRKIITEIDELAPEALISIGVWGDPFTHDKFLEFLPLLEKISNPILIESRSLFLNEDFVTRVQQRPNTNIVFDVSFTTESQFQEYKKSPYTLEQTTQFLKSLINKQNIWIRSTRSKENEASIKYFFQEWKEFMPRVIVNKADSFGAQNNKVVDLAPLKRHACYALRRELTIMNDGSVLLCRQSTQISGLLQNESLTSIWDKQNTPYQQHLNRSFNVCEQCSQCDDWWVWN